MDLSYILNSPDVERIASALELLAANSRQSIFTDAMKTALLNIFQHVAFTDDQGQSYYDALYKALYSGTLISINATQKQGYNPICTTDTLDSIRQYLTVEATYSTGSKLEVENYALSGNLTAGSATITVEYEGKTDTVQVEVTQLPDGYTHRECVVANGTQYINSGLSEVDVRNFGVAHKAARTSTTAGSTHILSSQNMYMPLFRLNSGADKCFITCNRLGGTTYTKTDEIASNIELGRAYELKAFMGGSNVITVDGIDCMIWPVGSLTPSASNELAFFTYGGNIGNTSYRFVGKFYYMKLFSGNTVTHNYIPCTNANNVAGLYDTVAGVFLAPAAGTLAWE